MPIYEPHTGGCRIVDAVPAAGKADTSMARSTFHVPPVVPCKHEIKSKRKYSADSIHCDVVWADQLHACSEGAGVDVYFRFQKETVI